MDKRTWRDWAYCFLIGALMLLTAPAAQSQTLAQTSAAPLSETAQTAPVLPGFVDEAVRLGEDRSERMTLPVEVSGLGPYPFVIDTGSQRSIVATELADRLSLPLLAPVTIISMAGREQVAAVHLPQIKFGSYVVKDLPALSIAHANLGGAGIIGLDGLKDKRLTLDFRANKMEVGRSRKSRRESSDGETIIVEARSRFGQLILVGSKIDNRKVSVVLDTGAELSIGNMALFRNLKQKKLVIPPTAATLTSVTGETVPVLFTIVRQINIESVMLENVPMVFLDAAPFDELDLSDHPAMLLGMKMLRMFDRVAIDFGNRQIDFHLPRGDNAPQANKKALAGL
jgi:predicted aspartyl protease